MARWLGVALAIGLGVFGAVIGSWSLAADAPWEGERVVEVVREVPADTDDPRCIAAETILSKYAELQGEIRGLRPLEPLQPLEPLRPLGALRPEEILEELVEQAERDMERYC